MRRCFEGFILLECVLAVGIEGILFLFVLYSSITIIHEIQAQHRVLYLLEEAQWMTQFLRNTMRSASDPRCHAQIVVHSANDWTVEQCVQIDQQFTIQRVRFFLKKNRLYRKIDDFNAQELTRHIQELQIQPIYVNGRIRAMRFWFDVAINSSIWEHRSYYFLDQMHQTLKGRSHLSWPIDVVLRNA